MRILLSAYGCDPGAGSEPGNGWNWARHLSEAGHDVWVLTGDPFGDKARLFEHARDVASLHIVHVPTPRLSRLLLNRPLGVYIHYLSWLRQSHIVAKRLTKSRPFDIAHHVSLGSLIWGSRLWRLGLPLVFGPIGGGQVTPRSLVHYAGPRWRREWLRSLVGRRIIQLSPMARSTVRHAMAVFATNSETELLARQLGGRSVHLVADTAVPPPMLRTDLPDRAGRDELSILWLARLLPRKGLPLALDALARLPSDVGWRCIIVGDGPYADQVNAWLDRAGISDRAKWMGHVPWADLESVYRQADIFFFTSLRDASGAQLYEAAAFGLPIVGLDHQGVADLIPDDVAIKVPVRDAARTAAGLAEALELLAREPERRRLMSEAALRFAKRNTWKVRIDQVYSIAAGLAHRPL